MKRLRIRRPKEKIADQDLETRLLASKARNKKLQEKYNEGVALYNDLLTKLVECGYATRSKDNPEQVNLNMTDPDNGTLRETIARVFDVDADVRTLSSFSAMEIYRQITTWILLKMIFNWGVKHSGKIIIAVFAIVILIAKIPL